MSKFCSSSATLDKLWSVQYTSPAAQRYRKQLEKEVNEEKLSAAKALKAQEAKPSGLEDSQAAREVSAATETTSVPGTGDSANGLGTETVPAAAKPPSGPSSTTGTAFYIILQSSLTYKKAVTIIVAFTIPFIDVI